MTIYKHKKFNTLDDLTHYLNALEIPKDRIIFTGIENSAMNGFSGFGLIYLEEDED
jgi:hypothetical protein